VYAKGALVLRMLRSVVGDTAFREILRTYATDPAFRYGNATTAQFQRIAESIYGAPLDRFFEQWVTVGTGYPRYRIEAESAPSAGGHTVSVVLEQQQTASESNVSVFEMPVTIAVTTSQGEERFVVTNDRRWQGYTFEVAGAPSVVELDPDGILLRDENIAAPVSAGARTPTFTAIVPNPTNRDTALRVSFPEAGDAVVEWYDVAGRRVRRDLFPGRPVGPQELFVGTNDLTTGVYFVRVIRGTMAGTRKLVVVR
jgi:hypothetical protein